MRKSLSRYIVYNAVMWMFLLLGGLIYLYLLRDYGQTVNARFTAAQLLEEADQYHEQNEVFESEQTLIRALNTYPEIASDVVMRFQARLIGMPGVMEELAELVAEEAEEPLLSPPAAGVHAMIKGNRDAAEERLREAARERNPPPKAHLYLARLLLEDGCLVETRAHFDAYWIEAADDRHSLASELTDPARLTTESVHHLLRRLVYAGLWEEAFDLLEDPEWTEGADSADLTFFLGLEAEAKGEKETARTLYETARQENSKHRWAGLRLAYLDKTS